MGDKSQVAIRPWGLVLYGHVVFFGGQDHEETDMSCPLLFPSIFRMARLSFLVCLLRSGRFNPIRRGSDGGNHMEALHRFPLCKGSRLWKGEPAGVEGRG